MAILYFCRLIVVKFTYRNGKIAFGIAVAFDSRLFLDKEFRQCAVKLGKCASVGKFYIDLEIPIAPVGNIISVEIADGIERRKVAIFGEIAVDGRYRSFPICFVV